MKRLVIGCLVTVFLFTILYADETEVLAKARDYIKQENYTKALQVIDEGVKEVGFTKKLMRLKYSVLTDMKKFDEAMVLLDQAIKTNGETSQILGEKVYLLQQQKKYDEALKVALRQEEIAKKKSPWICLDIADLYLELKNKEKAFTWINEAVERGFIDYASLQDEAKEDGIEGDPRLDKIVAKIKEKIGLGRQAKDFTVNRLNGTPFQLSKQKGKVVLVDFWATWCGPCRREIPNLKEYYKDLNKKGLEIIGISLDVKKEKLEEYIKKEKLAWNISFSGKGWDDETAHAYGVRSIPSYWLIDKKGNLRHFGLREEALKKAIEELILE